MYLDTLLAPHLQKDVDAILDAYRNFVRRNQLFEAVCVWGLLEDAKVIGIQKRKEKAEEISMLWHQAIHIPYGLEEADSPIRFNQKLKPPRFINGLLKEFPKWCTIDTLIQHVKATLRSPKNYGILIKQERPHINMYPSGYYRARYILQSDAHITQCSDELKKLLLPFMEESISYAFRKVYYFSRIFQLDFLNSRYETTYSLVSKINTQKIILDHGYQSHI